LRRRGKRMNLEPEDKAGQISDKHRLAAIVFADIVGSTATMERDEKLALQNLQRMREAAYPLVEKHEGKLIKELGDGFLAVFNSAIKATTCSLDIQKGLKDEKDPKLRISIHIGDVFLDRGDVFGSGVNIASRMNSHALPGGIAVSADVWRQLQNKGDYSVRSLGAKDLKGVGEPLEVFELLESAQALKIGVSFLQRLKRSRIPHYLIPYALGVWMIVQSTNWLANRYLLSPHLTNFIFTLLVTLIPTAFLLGYVRGHPGMKAKRYKKVGIPLNLALSGFLLFGLFRDKDLGSIMANVTLVNEQGQTLQRTIPKGEFRKRITFFLFENETGDTSLNWLQYGIPDLLANDLSQDLLFTVSDVYLLSDYLKRNYGLTEIVKLPMGLRCKIANARHDDYFVLGSFVNQGKTYTIKTSLFKTSNGKLLGEGSYKCDDIFKGADQITQQMKSDLKIPTSLLEETKDLPVADIFTNSFKAFRYYTEAQIKDSDKDWDGAIHSFEEAVKEDTTFATGYYLLSYLYNAQLQDFDKSKRARQQSVKYIYRMDEQTQMWVKYDDASDDSTKQLALLKMWVELYPDNTEIRSNLALTYACKGEIDKAVAEYEKILKIEPDNYYILFTIGQTYDFYGDKPNPDKAIKYYKKYSEHYPEKITPLLRIARAYGDNEKAMQYYKKALLIKPDDPDALVGLASFDLRSGSFKNAKALYFKALSNSKTAMDSVHCYYALRDIFRMQGQPDSVLKYHILQQEAEKGVLYGYGHQILTMKDLAPYIRAGRKDEALKIIEAIKPKVNPEDEAEVHLAYLHIYEESGDLINAEREYAIADSLVRGNPSHSRYDMLSCELLIDHFLILELRGSYQEAIDFYQKNKPLINGRSRRSVFGGHDPFKDTYYLGRCYGGIKNYKEAEKHFSEVLKIAPYFTETHYELALVYADMGKKGKAIEHLNKALTVWAEADTDYGPAKKAREKLAELQSKP